MIQQVFQNNMFLLELSFPGIDCWRGYREDIVMMFPWDNDSGSYVYRHFLYYMPHLSENTRYISSLVSYQEIANHEPTFSND